MRAKKPTRDSAAVPAGARRVAKKGQTARKRPVREPKRMPVDAQPRGRKSTRDVRPQRSAPRTTPTARPVDIPARPKSAGQAKARAKARKAKAPKVIRPPLRERILVRIASIELNPRRLVARVPFVVLVISALGLGLGVTLWLSTDAAERSYQLGNAREINQALMQQKESLERDVLEAQAAPALAEAARELGMIPSRDTAHLVQDASGNWVVVGTPKPAEGVPPPPLNAPLPEPVPPAPPAPRVVEPREVPVRIPSAPMPLAVPGAVPGAEIPHAASGQLPTPGPGPQIPPVAPLPVAPTPVPLPVAPLDAGPSHLTPGAPVGPAAPLGTEQFAPVAPAPGAPA
ncbi:hypothetical protein C6A85_000000102915 [Mycobacterium sp. ITM-2017-0098]|nr:hypothetical protein C6A85_000000102915 [Mycobacterium sp. ITM-2017-0098]